MSKANQRCIIKSLMFWQPMPPSSEWFLFAVRCRHCVKIKLS